MGLTKRYYEKVEAEHRAGMSPEERQFEDEQLDDERAAYEASHADEELDGGASGH